MPPREEDHALGDSEEEQYGKLTNVKSVSSRSFCPLLTVDLPSLQLLGPRDNGHWQGLGSDDEDELKEWIWQNHKVEILKNLRIKRRPKKEPQTTILPEQPVPVQVCKCSRDLELYKKRWELMDRVARATQNFLQNEGSRVVYKCLLNGILELEESEYGFIGEVRHAPGGGDPYIQIHASTTIAHASEEAKRFFEENDNFKFTNFQSMFGQIYSTKSHIISNNIKDDQTVGCPFGHPEIRNFLGLPLYGKSRGIPPRREVIGILCIGNKKGGYSKADVSFLEPFTATGSNLIQAYWQLEENTVLINDLEAKVRERTQSLQETNRQLEAANHLVVQTSRQQIQHFACMSHEIRTPLNCIVGLSSLLQGTDMSPLQKENLQMITASGDLLLNVVNDVLDFSKLATGHLEIESKRSNLQEALDATVYAIDMKAQTMYLTLRTTYDPRLPEYMETDLHRLQQILFNLLGNAVKFSHKGGEIELAVSVVSLHETYGQGSNRTGPRNQKTDPHANIIEAKYAVRTPKSAPSQCPFPDLPWQRRSQSACPYQQSQSRTEEVCSKSAASCEQQIPDQESTYIRFVVKDCGKGINSSELQNIFEPFRQESVYIQRSHGGTGLGLSITAKLVEALGGRIFVDSKQGEWTEFTVEIPLKGGEQPMVPSDLGRRLGEGTVVVYIGKDAKKTAIMKGTFDTCGINCVLLSQWHSIFSHNDRIQTLRNAARIVCMCHEELFDLERYRQLKEINPRTTLISHGQAHSNKESCLHIRSPTALLPCVLISNIETALHSTADEGDIDEPAPPQDMLALCPSSQHQPDISSLRVLVAEDNLINQKVMARMLERLGLAVVDMVDNGQKAVEMVDANEYDVALMDIQMPVMNGIQACRIIVGQQQSKQNKVKVIFVSANVSCDDELINAGAWDCLPKPFKLENIRTCLERVVLGRAN